MEIRIRERNIGNDSPTYVIAEIGINHNGDEAAAIRLIDAAVSAQADAVKFQKRHLESLYPRDLLDHPEKYEQTFQYMIPILKETELGEKTMARLKRYADGKGIDFICTPFDCRSADFLQSLDIAAFKIASADLTNIELLEHVASFGKPMILSTGMSSWDEIKQAVSMLKGRQAAFALLHCRSVYPVWPREVNLRMINRLKEFEVPVGYSGHELGITISLVAASMGAAIIEKHITLDRRQRGPDHKVSLEPYELKRLIRDIRTADQAIGKEKRLMLRGEVLNRELFSKSLVAKTDLRQGTVLTREMIAIRGPGKGLAPNRSDEVVGKPLLHDIKAGTCFHEEDFVETTVEDFSSLFHKKWGLIARFTDFLEMASFSPKVLEFHLAERDFDILFEGHATYDFELVVHTPEYLGDNLMDLCCADEAIRQKSVQLVLKTIELTRKIANRFTGRPKVIAHPGAMSFREKLVAAKLEKTLARSLDEIRQHSGIDDVELLLENLPPYPWYFGGQWKGNFFMDGEEIARFCTKHALNICFDLSHAALYCNAKEKDLAEEILKMLPVTHHLHLADGYGLDGEGVQFGEGDIDLDAIIPLFKTYKGSWVPEVWRGHLHGGRGFLDALKFLSKYDVL